MMMQKKWMIAMFCLMPFPAICQFQATMINRVSGKEMKYAVYSDLNRYRYEFDEGGTQGIVIAMPGENTTFILMPGKKLVHKTTCDAAMSRMNDPVQSYEWFKENGIEKNEGTETLNGFDCRKLGIYQQDQKIFTVWYADALHFPVKIENNVAGNTSMELTDVSKWKVNPDFFKVPADYSEVDERLRPVIPEPPPPDKWTAKEVTIPYKDTANRGTKLKLMVDRTVYYKVSLSDNGESPAKIVIHMIRNGSELTDDEQGPLRYRTIRLFNGESKTSTYDWKAGDLIILEVFEGTMEINIYPEK